MLHAMSVRKKWADCCLSYSDHSKDYWNTIVSTRYEIESVSEMEEKKVKESSRPLLLSFQSAIILHFLL